MKHFLDEMPQYTEPFVLKQYLSSLDRADAERSVSDMLTTLTAMCDFLIAFEDGVTAGGSDESVQVVVASSQALYRAMARLYRVH